MIRDEADTHPNTAEAWPNDSSKPRSGWVRSRQQHVRHRAMHTPHAYSTVREQTSSHNALKPQTLFKTRAAPVQ